MNNIQTALILSWGVYSLFGFIYGYAKTAKRNNPYGLCYWFNPLGAFVWADAVVFGLFFFLVSIVSLLLQDFILFLLFFFVFWTIRSIGEQVYWFLEQFAVQHRNPEHTLWAHRFFPRNSVWIANQIYWQCVSVIAIIGSVYLFVLWLS